MANKKYFNKIGAEKIISIYWFVILIIVTGGIYAMVSTFYGHPYDVREAEASILANNIVDCISEKGVLKDFVFDKEINFLNQCKINLSVEDGYDGRGQYYFEVNFFDINENSLGNILEGNNALKSDCELTEKKGYENLPKCVNKRFYLVKDDKTQVLVDVLSVVRKNEKNLKI